MSRQVSLTLAGGREWNWTDPARGESGGREGAAVIRKKRSNETKTGLTSKRGRGGATRKRKGKGQVMLVMGLCPRFPRFPRFPTYPPGSDPVVILCIEPCRAPNSQPALASLASLASLGNWQPACQSPRRATARTAVTVSLAPPLRRDTTLLQGGQGEDG